MGCFNVRCNLSGLPIYSDDKVRAVICLPNLATYRSDVSMCYSTDMKQPCLLPVLGQYDDYGAIEKVTEDAGSILSCGHLDDLLKDGQIRYNEHYNEYQHRDETGMERWVKLITGNEVEVCRHGKFDKKSKKEQGTNFSVAFVLEKAYQGYLKVYDPRERLREELDDWFKWYVAVTKKLLGWIAENPDDDDRRFKSIVLSRWAYQASYFAAGDVDDKSYIPIKLPVLKTRDGRYGLHPLFGFVGENARYVECFWFLHAYGDLLEALVRSKTETLKDVKDPRWTRTRDAFVDFMPLCYLMDRLRQTWLPTITAGQDRDYEFDFAIGKVNTGITNDRLKKWKRENGE